MTRPTSSPSTVTLQVPFRITQRGGRKEVHLPAGAPRTQLTDNTLVKALGRAFRWKKMLETGEYTTIKELADHEDIAFSYMTRVLRMTLLSPKIVEAVLEGKGPDRLTLSVALEPFPLGWQEQEMAFLEEDNQAAHL
ncbi:hypothetical protein [Heliomarina baculiformis]|uniref:hypothetical protein n=1 Tax=Heliomarina baculiformis TaxID=2872036 RepID=UPI001EE340E5|nr:hypothetical protein [Heliomarina baculiformis]